MTSAWVESSDQRLTVLELAGRLVEGEAGFGLFLDQQELSVALNDRGNGDIGFPDHDGLKRQNRYFTR